MTSTQTNVGNPPTGPVAPLLDSTLTTNHKAYQIGERVRITLAVHGQGTARVSSSSTPHREQITVLDGTRVISRMTRRIPASTWKRLDVGRTVKLTAVWSGRPNQPGVTRLEPGSYTIEVASGDHAGSTAIRIGRKGS